MAIDGHERNRSAAFEEFCHDNKIISIIMPSNSSSPLNSLNIGCFNYFEAEQSKISSRSILHTSPIPNFQSPSKSPLCHIFISSINVIFMFDSTIQA